MLFIALLLAVVALSVWSLTRFHRGQPREWIAGAVAIVTILVLEYAIISEGWLRGPLRWMADLAPPAGSMFEEKFFDDDRFLTWQANVLLLAVAAIAWTLWHLVNRQRTDDAELPLWLRGKPLRSYYFWLLVTVAGATVFASHVVVALYAEGYAWAEPFALTLQGVFWAAPLVFCAILYGAARVVAIAPQGSVLAPPEEESPPPRIHELIAYLRASYSSDHVLFAEGSEGGAGAASGLRGEQHNDLLLGNMHRRLRLAGGHALLPGDIGRALAEVFGDFWGDRPPLPGEPPWSPWNVLLTEDLAQAHLLLMIELMQSCHDRGGTVLMIAPASSIGRVKRTVEAIGDADWTDITLRSCLLDDGPIDSARQFNVIFTSDEVLESGLLAETGNVAVARFLDLLVLVVVFDFHLLEAAMLRLRLQRLRWLLERRHIPINIRVICQTENRATAQAAMRDTFAPLGIAAVRTVRPIVRNAIRHTVIWRGDEAALRALAQLELGSVPAGQPLEVAALAAIPPLRFDVRTAYLDGTGRWDSRIWKIFLPTQLSNQLGGSLPFSSVGLGEDRFPRADVRNLIVEDRGNLADAVAQHRNYPGQDEYVLTIVAHRYPLRDWFIDLFRSGNINDPRMLPISPAPRGGLTELAMILAEEFRGSRPVPQSSLDDRFLNLVEPRTAAAFDLFPTPKGVSTLFQGETGQELNVVSHADPYHDITFSRLPGMQPPRPPVLVLAASQQGDTKTLFRLAPGDHGLRYAVGTTVHSGGLPYRVTSVGATQVGVAGANTAIRISRNAFLFHRQYRIDFAADRAVLALENENRSDRGEGRAYWRLALRGEFARHTAARATVEETAPPFSPNRPTWDDADVRKNPRHAAMLLLRIELAAVIPADLIHSDRHGAIAFTLAATMQDVLGSLFPPFAHRIAVVSPQAATSVNIVLRDGDAQGINRFPADLYPRLVASFRANAAERRSNPALDNAADVDGFLARNGISMPDVGTRCLHLLMVEDADHDLGIVRALFIDQDILDRLFHVWSEFLRWLVAHRDDKDLYYRFGSPGLSTCFAFEEASAVLDAIVRS